MFARLGRVVVHHPWKVIGLWVLAIVAVLSTAPTLTATTDQSEFLPSHYESIQAMKLQEQAFPQYAAPAALIVVVRADGAALTEGDSAAVTATADALTARNIKGVNGIQVTPPSENRLVQVIAVQMTKLTDAADKTQGEAVKSLREQLREQVRDTGLKAGITGTAAQTLDQTEEGEKGMAIIGIATIVLILVLLLIIFRSPVIALLPVITIGAISSTVSGLIAMAAKAFDLDIDTSISAILLVVLFGVGTDYILFLMFRYRERLRAGDEPKTAMVNAVARVGEAITSAAAAVIIAFMALTLSSLGMFRALGPALAIAVAVALLAGLTLVPAIVSLLGTKVFWPSKAWQVEPRGARFGAIGAAMGRRPGVFAVASGGVLVALGVFAIGFNPTFDLSSGSTSDASEPRAIARTCRSRSRRACRRRRSRSRTSASPSAAATRVSGRPAPSPASPTRMSEPWSAPPHADDRADETPEHQPRGRGNRDLVDDLATERIDRIAIVVVETSAALRWRRTARCRALTATW